MGILFGLVITMAFIAAAAFVVAFVLERWSRQRAIRHGRENFPVRTTAIAVFSLILMVYGWATLIGYGIWCEEVRHVDMGIGDSAMVPIGYGYSFIMIDTSNYGSLKKDNNAIAYNDFNGGPAHISGVTDLGLSGGYVMGIDNSGAFILDIASDRLTHYPDIDEAAKALPSPPELESAFDFYNKMRWGWPDLAAFGLILIPAICLLFIWYLYLIRSMKGS